MPGALLLPGPAMVPQGLPAEDGTMRYAADLSVLLSWWKLLDARRDSRGPRRLAAKAALLLYRRSYRRASARHPALDAAFGTELARLQALEDEKAPASTARRTPLPRCCGTAPPTMTAGSVGRSSCYCTTSAGICIWLLEDLPRDVRAGAYNPLRYRYCGRRDARSGGPGTASCSKRSTPPSAWPARPWSCWTGGATGSCFPTSYISDSPPCSMQSRRERSARRETGGKHEGPLWGSQCATTAASEDEIQKGLPGACAEIPSR